MKHCSRCGQENELRIPEGEDRERHVCATCGAIHYQNPKMVVGCIIEHDDRVLLCKRAIQPRLGYWTIPAGFMELGESAPDGAARETFEEARARVEIVAPYAHFDVPHIGQAYLIYRARLAEAHFEPGPESLEVELVRTSEIPWEELAFKAVRFSLELLCADRERGHYHHHLGTVEHGEDGFVLKDHRAFALR